MRKDTGSDRASEEVWCHSACSAPEPKLADALQSQRRPGNLCAGDLLVVIGLPDKIAGAMDLFNDPEG